MQEIGIDIAGHRAKHVNEFLGQDFDYVLTPCDNANETCPVFPAKSRRLHRNFEDPAGVQGDGNARLAVFRRVRDEIRDCLKSFPAAACP